MSDLHIWTGLLVGWILYAVFLTGTLAFFRDETSLYMRPELPAAQQREAAPVVAQRLADHILASSPNASQLSISLPTERNPTASAFARSAEGGRRGFSSATYDPATAEKLDARETRGGDFFYTFHFNLHYMPALWARWLVGLCAMFMLVAIVSGVITHKKIFTDFFTFRWGKGQRAWLDAHNALSVLGLPFHFMITWSGLITLMVLYMPWGLEHLPSQADRAAVTGEMRFFLPPARPAGTPAELVAINGLVEQAEARWGAGHVGAVQIANPGDANARIAIVRQQASRVSTTPNYLLFDGVSGDLTRAKDASGPVATTQGVLYGLHLGRFADPVLRWLYFLVSLAGTAMVGTGLVLWIVKRRAKLPDPDKPYFGFWLVERLNIGAIAGLSVAVPALFWANRLLPLELAERGNWEIHCFFIAWAGALAWAFVRPAKRAWVELLWLAAALLAALPLANFLLTDRNVLISLWTGDWVFAGFELTLLAFAAAHAWLAIRTLRHQPKAKPVRKTMAKPTAPKVARAEPATAEPAGEHA
ncbi:PepSY-associated TM helix domain-containing protein [Corticibacter populi]